MTERGPSKAVPERCGSGLLQIDRQGSAQQGLCFRQAVRGLQQLGQVVEVYGLRITAAEIVSETIEDLGRRPQRLKPLGDLGFCQLHRLQELDVIGQARLEIRVLEAERK